MLLARLLSVVFATVLTGTSVLAQAAATPADLDRLAGPGWTGTLTYRDYTSDARTTIKAAPLLIRLADTDAGGARWDFRMAYADEPHANSGDTLVLSADGRSLRGASILERTPLADGRVRIVTEQEGRDNERAARIRTVYVIGERTASLQKLVRYADGDYFERHIYEWVR